ncbi:MAG: hypothetical protein AVDCRST_MAG35-2082, partial [uncultured Quadrisphaera sp.]
MDVTSLTDVLGSDAPSTTVTIDATNADEAGAHEREVRWQDLRRSLEQDGAPAEDLAALDAVVGAPTGAAGPATRFLAARGGQVLLDRVLHEGTRDGVGRASTGPVVDVVPLLRYEQRHAPVVVVRADRGGADIEVVTAAGGPATDSTSVDGSTLHLHKVGLGGWAAPQFQRHSENTWATNAAEAATEVQRLAREAGAAAVVVAGDVHARRLLVSQLHLPEAVAVAEVEGDARADGASQVAVESSVAVGLDERAARTEDEAVSRWRAVHDDPATASRSTDSLDATVAAVRQGQVEELLLVPAALRERTLRIGPAPTDVATT